MKWDTVTSSVSGGLQPRLLSAKCQRSRTCEGQGGGGNSMAGNLMVDQETSQEHEPVGHL